jgi:ankyrin repeat protein
LHSGGCSIPSFSDDDIFLRIPPLLTAVTSDQPEVAELLLQFGAKTEIRTRNGTTALHEVIKLQREDLVRLLINHGADIKAGVQQKDVEGCTPLHFAAGTSDLNMAELLLDHRANGGIRAWLDTSRRCFAGPTSNYGALPDCPLISHSVPLPPAFREPARLP